jgi:hypothetical protein
LHIFAISGIDRGPVLEVIVARMNLMSRETQRKVRIVGLSTALANAGDVADWLGIEKVCCSFNNYTQQYFVFSLDYTIFVHLYDRCQSRCISQDFLVNTTVRVWRQ